MQSDAAVMPTLNAMSNFVASNQVGQEVLYIRVRCQLTNIAPDGRIIIHIPGPDNRVDQEHKISNQRPPHIQQRARIARLQLTWQGD